MAIRSIPTRNLKSGVFTPNSMQNCTFELIEKRAARMPAAYGKAFRYIAYRDLNERMKMYLEIAERRIQPETCDSRLVATQAA